jgi:NAD(P)-dependent dehydrogenase (short-subunit alcohol dehydrogenase family)
MTRFAGKVCLVTGAARGIGAAIAQAFAEEGAAVVLTDQNAEQVASTAAEIGQCGLVQDVADEARWVEVVAEVERRYGRLDILVANAGYGWQTPVTEIALADWRRLMAVNVDGVFLAMKHGIPLITRSGGGSIVAMSSMYGTVGAPGTSAYCASKGAVTLLTKAVALECAEQGNGIRVNSIHPGYVMTPSVREVLTPEQIEGLRLQHPVGRLAEPAEIARATLFLASDDASFMTGAELHVDGGFTTR